MDRDTIVLLALVMLAAAALAVSASGWIIFARDHRAWKTARAASDATHPEAREEH